MHTCNNPLCVNPAHLVLGTVKQNIRDAARDGLFSTSKVADEDVIDMAARQVRSVSVRSSEAVRGPPFVREQSSSRTAKDPSGGGINGLAGFVV